MHASLLLLADGRTPAGGHAHSGGLEAAVAGGLVVDAATLRSWLAGRLETVGRVDSACAAAWWALAQAGAAGSPAWSRLADEYWARVPSASLRAASRTQARGVLRAGRAMWPGRGAEAAASVVGGAPWPMAFAAVAWDSGASLTEMALLVSSASVTGPAWAATRLLGLDPYAVARCLADLSGAVEAVAEAAVAWADVGPEPGAPAQPPGPLPATSGPPPDRLPPALPALSAPLPALSAPLLDLGAEWHATWEVRLFAS